VHVLTWLIALGYVVIFGCWLLVRYDLVAKRPTALVALSSLGIATLAWMLTMLIDVVRTVPSLFDPAAEMARQFDIEVKIENDFLPKFRSLPITVLSARHKRLEWQLARWEKWLDAARLLGALGPPLYLLVMDYSGRFLQKTALYPLKQWCRQR
jgi:hypothetical protein